MASSDHNSTKEAWQGAAAERWVQEQARFDELLKPFGQAASTTLAAVSGEWILDVGCGAGTTSLELAQSVGPQGGVYGIDISEALLDRARERAAAQGASNTRWVLADASTHRFERGFDALYSRFGVMFFTNPVDAFSHLRAALQPSGRIAFVCWQELERNPWANKPLTAAHSVAPHLPMPTLIQPGQPGPFAFGDQDYLNDTLRAAGFRHVDITPFERPVHLGSTAEDAAEYCLFFSPASRLADSADEALRQSMRAAVARALGAHETSRGVLADAATYVVSARA
jgi:ubiquinone/menaquinone biosynthesis C-methylase UbiE